MELDIGDVAIDLDGDAEQEGPITGFEVYDEDLERQNDDDNILGGKVSAPLSEPAPNQK